jgi:hypothetical protein
MTETAQRRRILWKGRPLEELPKEALIGIIDGLIAEHDALERALGLACSAGYQRKRLREIGDRG